MVQINHTYGTQRANCFERLRVRGFSLGAATIRQMRSDLIMFLINFAAPMHIYEYELAV